MKMKKYSVCVYEKHCKVCGVCIGLCHREVFRADYLGKAVVEDPDKCSECKNV